MSSSGVEDLHPHGGPMSSRRGGIIIDGPPLKIPSEPRDLASLGWNWKETIPVIEDLKNDQIGPKPAGECTRMTRIKLCGSKSMTRPPHGVTYIFVQGKESACILSRDLFCYSKCGRARRRRYLTCDLTYLVGQLVCIGELLFVVVCPNGLLTCTLLLLFLCF